MPPPRRGLRLAALALTALFAAVRASAGPPFLTDDPEPVPYRHWEAYLFSTLDDAPDGSSGMLPAVELNYGAAPGLQLHLILPATFDAPAIGPRTSGFGDVQLGFKFRFLEETADRPQAGIFPTVTLATGDARRGLGGGGSAIELPLWLQKSWGPWTTYGGGGYTVNRAVGGVSYPFAGWLLQRDLGERLTLGAEVFTQGRSATDAPATTLVNAGGQINFGAGFSLLFSLGHSVGGARHRVAYFGLYWTWGPARR